MPQGSNFCFRKNSFLISLSNVGDLSKIGLEDRAPRIKKKIEGTRSPPSLTSSDSRILRCSPDTVLSGLLGDPLIVSREAAHWSLNTHRVMV